MPVSRVSSSTSYTPRTGGAYSGHTIDKLEGNPAPTGQATGTNNLVDLITSLDMPKIERVANTRQLRSPLDEQIPTEDSDELEARFGGTIMRSVDGDIAEISAESMERASSANLTVAEEEAEDEPAQKQTANEIRYQARQLLIQGQIDTTIKNQTGITQAELDRIKAALEGKTG